MKSDEEAAEEWCREKEFMHYAMIQTTAGYAQGKALRPFEECVTAFIAGAKYARTPIKINLNDESTWPKPYQIAMLFDGEKWWFGHWDCATMECLYSYGAEHKTDKIVTHWLPLPILEEDK